jgi:hypothetical protein
MKKLYFLICLLITTICASAAEINFGWDANTETDLVGYRFYYSINTGQYTTNKMMEILGRTNTTATVNRNLLTLSKTNYFVVTAFNVNGMESDYSNEVNARIPGSPSGVGITYNKPTKRIILSWTLNPTADGVTNYIVYERVGTVYTAIGNTNGTSYTFAPQAGFHYFVIAGQNEIIESPFSLEVSYQGVGNPKNFQIK